MNHLAFPVPNHEFWRITDSYGLNVCELSIVVFVHCEESKITRDYWYFVVIFGLPSVMITPRHSLDTMTTSRSEGAVINHVVLNFTRRLVLWLSSGSHASRLSQCICVGLVVRVADVADVLRVLRGIILSFLARPNFQRCWDRTRC